MIENSEATERLCMQGHGMIGLVGNYFFGDDPEQVLPASCNFCDRVTSTDIMYDYCFHCSCFLCRECTEEYKKYNPKESWLSVQREEVAVKITDPAQINAECAKNKSLLVLFYIDNSSASLLFKDSLVYHQGKLLVQPGKYIPKIALANCSTNKNLVNAFKLTDFPTFILFDGKGKPVRTLIGYSWLEVPFFYETQRRLISGESIEI